jgi:hypothetical protein
MLLCWRGFSGAVVEAAYLAFKARHLLLVDWVGRVYLLVFVPSMMLRYLLTHGLWPLQKVYGKSGPQPLAVPGCITVCMCVLVGAPLSRYCPPDMLACICLPATSGWGLKL